MFLTPIYEFANSTQPVLGLTNTSDRSFYWVPNSHNPVPPGPYLAQGTFLYEVKFHTRAYNLTLDLAPFNSSQDIYTSVVLRNEFESGTQYAHEAAYAKSGVIFLNDTSEFLGCDSQYSYTLHWQASDAGAQAQAAIGHDCSSVIVSIAYL
ncbi:hypothetical protein DRE_00134 [Drechslerella stenobrocha 248]|uniref:Uncharacterized protein n=1 Tax=Drechslerella stenobrocha 248 TaxID=1043628 RepID=W7HZ82_9PEZI|nr:hypothetical protein DRE_00134 [Drechslerella stenobrocha 248]